MSSAGSPADRSEAVAPLLDYHAIAETNFSSPQDIVVADDRAGEPSARRIEQSQYRPWQRGGRHSALDVLPRLEELICQRDILGGRPLADLKEPQRRRWPALARRPGGLHSAARHTRTPLRVFRGER